eukprot:Awhi_evm1s13712
MILHDGKADITADNIKKIIDAAGVTGVEPYWLNVFAKAFETADIEAMCSSFSVAAPSGGAAPAAGAAAGGAAAAVEEEPEEEKESSEDFGGGGGLFGDDDEEEDW